MSEQVIPQYKDYSYSPCEQVNKHENVTTIVAVSSALAVGGASALYSHYKKNSLLKSFGFFLGGVAVSGIPLGYWAYHTMHHSEKIKEVRAKCEIERAQETEERNRRYTVTFV